ncbi:MAG: purine-nucleoside phosphorylase [Cyclobacteriaceae bacterium]|nr:purine-nucleoside phosphorylase [Cyclobacteriaceae bacterium]
MSVHIGAKLGDIAETVLLPGDPLRAKFVAENMMEDAVCYNEVRGMHGYTGTYKGKRVSIQGAGMGIPSTSIYVNELIEAYKVKTIIRVGTFGSIQKDMKVGQVALAMSASTDSNINKIRFNGQDYGPAADFQLLMKAYNTAKELGIDVEVGNIFSADSFYNPNPDWWKVWAEYGVLGAEMESSAIYTIAAKHKIKALSVLTVSDNIVTGHYSSAKEREESFTDMATIALEIAE